jgi:hypothetical protein
MAKRFPGYDVLAKREGISWNDATRRVITARLNPPPGPRFFTPAEWPCLRAICARILPQPDDRPPVAIADYVDQKLHDGVRDGYRYADLPEQGEAWRRGLAGLDEAARNTDDAAFSELLTERQDRLLRSMQAGELDGPAWCGMPAAAFFAHRLIPDITHAYYAHPTAWSEIGFGGPASPRGYVRMKLNRRDPWEAAEATTPSAEAKAAESNRRVR